MRLRVCDTLSFAKQCRYCRDWDAAMSLRYYEESLSGLFRRTKRTNEIPETPAHRDHDAAGTRNESILSRAILQRGRRIGWWFARAYSFDPAAGFCQAGCR